MSDDFLGHYLSGRKVAIIVRFLYLGNHFLLNVLSISPGRYCHLFTKMYRERRSSVYVVYKRKGKSLKKETEKPKKTGQTNKFNATIQIMQQGKLKLEKINLRYEKGTIQYKYLLQSGLSIRQDDRTHFITLSA